MSHYFVFIEKVLILVKNYFLKTVFIHQINKFFIKKIHFLFYYHILKLNYIFLENNIFI